MRMGDAGRILITGTSSGIGEATANLFLEYDYTVIGIDREGPVIEDPNYVHYKVDMREMYLLPELHNLDYIVFNAGVLQKDEDPIGVNIHGTLNCEDRYVRSNLSTLKAIVILSSTAAHDGQDCREYVISKGGLLAYTKHLANCLGPWGIRVNSLSPGAGETPMNRRHFDPETYKAVAKQNLLKRWNQPEECAKAVYFFLVEATFTTGEDLKLDGGELIYTRYIFAENEYKEYPLPENLMDRA